MSRDYNLMQLEMKGEIVPPRLKLANLSLKNPLVILGHVSTAIYLHYGLSDIQEFCSHLGIHQTTIRNLILIPLNLEENYV
jgi:hypothetical protein